MDIERRPYEKPASIIQTIGNINAVNSKVFAGILYEAPPPPSPLLSLPTATAAAYDSAASQDAPTCLPGTRLSVLDELYAWVSSDHGGDAGAKDGMLWLNGMVGTGKSTIMRTICRRLHGDGLLGASFFFSRGNGDVARGDLFFTTIAKQLAVSAGSEFKKGLEAAITKNPDIGYKARIEQWEKLILGPLNGIKSEQGGTRGSVLVIAIDALDECDKELDAVGIISILAKAQEVKSVNLRFIIASRPETYIRAEFQRPDVIHRVLMLHTVLRKVIDEDIETFFRRAFQDLVRRKPWLPADWPGEDRLNKLIKLTGGLFIFAATVTRFVSESGSTADDALNGYLGIREDQPATANSSSGSESDADESDIDEDDSTSALDHIYGFILGQAVAPAPHNSRQKKLTASLKKTLGALAALAEPLTVEALSKLMGKSADQIYEQLSQLHSVISVPQDNEGSESLVRFLHTSFRDFLLSPKKCSTIHIAEGHQESKTPFPLESEKLHRRLATDCLKILDGPGVLRQDICSIKAVGTLSEDVEPQVKSDAISLLVAYCCRRWSYHLEQHHFTQPGQKIKDGSQAHQFMKIHLLHWVEVLGWLRFVSEGVSQIKRLEPFIEESQMSVLLEEAGRFMLRNLVMIQEAPLQLYCSALAFAPLNGLVRRLFASASLVKVNKQPNPTVTENSGQVQFGSHGDYITFVAVSPDGKLLASASNDRTARLWNPATGEQLHELKGHSDAVTCVAFSSDGQSVVSSSERLVKIWDTATGETRREIGLLQYDAHASSFNGPDGTLIASIITEHFLLLDPEHEESPIFQIHYPGGLDKAALSPNAELLALVNTQATIAIVDIKSRRQIFSLTHHENQSPPLITFTSSNKLLTYPSSSSVAHLWNTSGEISKSLPLPFPKFHLCALALSPDEQTLFCGLRNGSIQAHHFSDTSSSTLEPAPTRAALGHENSLSAIAFAPNGENFVTAGWDGTVKAWRTTEESLAEIWKLEMGEGERITALAFSLKERKEEGMLVAFVSEEKVWIHDLFTGEEVGRFEPERGGLSDVIAFHCARNGAGTSVLASAYRRTVQIWNLETGEEVGLIHSVDSEPCGMAFSGDGRMLALGSRDGTVRVWRVDSKVPEDEEAMLVVQAGGVVDRIAFLDTKDEDGDEVKLGSYLLRTNVGDFESRYGESCEFKGRGPESRNLRLEGGWITEDGERKLWLPEEYRGACADSWGNAIAVGMVSGGITVFRLGD